MARKFGVIHSGIWSDPDFCALGAGAQRTYFMLTSQPDILACGLLSMTLRRWGQTCADKDLAAWLDELTDTGYVVIDDGTEELLVRTFAKWDGGYKHPKRAKAVVSTAESVRSQSIRSVIVGELRKLGLPTESIEPRDQPRGTDPNGYRMAIDSGRVKVNSPKQPEPGSGNQDPETGNLPHRDAARPSQPEPFEADRFGDFWSAYPRKAGKAEARKAWAKAVRKTDADTLIAAAASYAADPNRNPKYTAHASTWLNQERWDDEPLPADRPVPDDDDLFGRALARAQAREERS